MNDKTPSSTTRDTILRAAGQVVLSDGVARLTLEAVAKEAGLSKGGLLYHFPSKQALIEGMLSQLSDVFTARLERALDTDDSADDRGRWLRAYARATFAAEQEPLAVSAGLLAAVATNPDLLAPLRDNFARWQQLAEADGLDPAVATLIRLAVEGLWFADLFDFASPREPLRSQVLEALLEIIRESAG